MAIKHFEKYFDEIEAQYLQMKQDLEQLEELCLQKAVDPDLIDNYKITLGPIKEAYNILCHVQYLLHLPQRNKKLNKFKKPVQEAAGKKILEKCKDTNAKLQEMKKDV